MEYAHQPGPAFRRHLLRAITKAGSLTDFQRALSKASGKAVHQARIWNWLNRDQELPAVMAIAIEQASAGAVTRHQLRPDLYPASDAR